MVLKPLAGGPGQQILKNPLSSMETYTVEKKAYE